MIQIAEEAPTQCMDDIGPLLKRHWDEVALHKKERPLSPNFDEYKRLALGGRLVVVTARDTEFQNALVGYSVFFIHNHIHYSTCKVASNDVLFVDKDYRSRPGVSIRLIRTCETVLANRGVDYVTWHIKPRQDWSQVLERMGYELEEKIMGRILSREATGDRHGI